MKFTVKQAREYAGLTQQQMGDFLGIGRDTYAKREANPGTFTVDQGKIIAEKTGVPMDAIIF